MVNIEIYGAVIANGKLYEDNSIADLLTDGGDVGSGQCGQYYDHYVYMRRHTNLKKIGWSYAGSQMLGESNILISVFDDNNVLLGYHIFDGKGGLREALAFLKSLTLYTTYKLKDHSPM